MLTEKQTIIVTTPEELMPLITEAVRAAGCGHPSNISDGPHKKLLAPKDVEREFGRRVFYERAVLEEYIASGRIQTSESK